MAAANVVARPVRSSRSASTRKNPTKLQSPTRSPRSTLAALAAPSSRGRTPRGSRRRAETARGDPVRWGPSAGAVAVSRSTTPVARIMRAGRSQRGRRALPAAPSGSHPRHEKRRRRGERRGPSAPAARAAVPARERERRHGEAGAARRQRPGQRSRSGQPGVGQREDGLRDGAGESADGRRRGERRAVVEGEEEGDRRRGERQPDQPAAHRRDPSGARPGWPRRSARA